MRQQLVICKVEPPSLIQCTAHGEQVEKEENQGRGAHNAGTKAVLVGILHNTRQKSAKSGSKMQMSAANTKARNYDPCPHPVSARYF